MDGYIVFGIITLLIMFYRYLTKNDKYWYLRQVPHVSPVFILGNVKDFVLSRRSVAEVYRDLYEKFPGERMIGAFRLREPELIIRDPDDIKRVLISDFHHFGDRANDANEKAAPLSANLFNVKYDQWKLQRQKMSPTFTSGKLKNMFYLIREISEEFDRYIENAVSKGGDIEVKELNAKFTTDVIGSCAFGIKMNTISDQSNAFRAIGKKIFDVDLKKFVNLLIQRIFPELFNYFNLRIHDKSIDPFIIDLVKEITEERKKNGIVRHDFIDLLLEAKSQNDLEKDNESRNQGYVEFNDTFIAAQTFLFFAAGFETSSTLMTFTLHELAYNPDCQDRVYEEICAVLEKHDGKLTYDSVMQMSYLNMVIKETQRFYPAIGVLSRRCTIPYKFPDSHLTVEKGTSVAIPVLGLHHDSSYYPEPEKFIPERFTAEEVGKRHSMLHLPFGEGPRNCIGLRFGKMQSAIGLITILRKYKVFPSTKTDRKLKLHTSSLVLTTSHPVWLKFEIRR